MGNEATKTRETWGPEIIQILSGKGLDIGAGADPIAATARVFDLQHGDAGRIDEYLDEQFDYVFSSHCLEHMHNPPDALRRWWRLVRPGGHLILIVPEETLYEQGFWPSIFNEDHKATFRLTCETWSPVSLQVQRLVDSLDSVANQSLLVQDHGFDYRYLRKPSESRAPPRLRLWFFKKLRKLISIFHSDLDWRFMSLLGVPVDQTAYGALAQIQVVLQKKT